MRPSASDQRRLRATAASATALTCGQSAALSAGCTTVLRMATTLATPTLWVLLIPLCTTPRQGGLVRTVPLGRLPSASLCTKLSVKRACCWRAGGVAPWVAMLPTAAGRALH